MQIHYRRIFMPFQHSHIDAIKQILSSNRFGAYRQSKENYDAEILANYLWNMSLCEALYPSLQSLEIALRNRLDQAISELFTTSNWFDLAPNWLYPIEQKKIRDAKDRITRRGRIYEPGHIIAELTLGFWTNLFDKRYEQILWPALLQEVFPAMPRYMRTRQAVAKQVNRIRGLRNRIFHYEPIWSLKDLSKQHDEILLTISWLSPELRTLLSAFDRFPEVYSQGNRFYLDKIEMML